MESEYGIHFGIVHHAFFNHQRCATFFIGGRTFLSWLKEKLHRSGDVFFHAGKHFCSAHQDGGMGIVTTGMHDTHGSSHVVCSDS